MQEKHNIIIKHIGDDYYENATCVSSINVIKANSYISNKQNTAYIYSDDFFSFGIYTKSENRKVMGVKLKLKIYTGKKYKTYYLEGSSGTSLFSANKVSLGKHKVIVSIYKNKNVNAKTLTTYITLKKASYKITASPITVKYKNKKYLAVKVQNKYSLNPIKNKKITVNVYTGKKYKKYNLKTNSKGIAYLPTRKLSLGTHKVKINIAKNKYYNSASKKTYVYVKKYIPQTTTYTHRTSYGYLDGYYEDYDIDTDIHYQNWLGSEYSDPYGMVDVEIENNKIKLDSVTVTYKCNGKFYTKKVSVYGNFGTYTYIPKYITYLKTTIKWHYK